VIDAQLALTQAKTNHAQALYDYNVNMAKLEKSMGVKV
jgi:outer membrane protein